MEYAIITLITADGTWKEDFELPVQVKIKELESKIISVLQSHRMPKGFSDAEKVLFSVEGKTLDAERTLAEYQMWDGSIITICPT